MKKRRTKDRKTEKQVLFLEHQKLVSFTHFASRPSEVREISTVLLEPYGREDIVNDN